MNNNPLISFYSNHNNNYFFQENHDLTKRTESTKCQSILSEMIQAINNPSSRKVISENYNKYSCKFKAVSEKPKGPNNVFKQINELCEEFGPAEVSARLGKIGVSAEDFAREGRKLSPQQVDNLYDLLKNEKAKEFTWKDPSLKKAGQLWHKHIQSGQIPQKKSMLAYFEREAYRAYEGERYELKPFLEDVKEEYGDNVGRIADRVLQPSTADRLRVGYGITAPEMEEVLEIIRLIFEERKTTPMRSSIRQPNKHNYGWSDDSMKPVVWPQLDEHQQKKLRDAMWSEWHRFIQVSSDEECSPQHSPLINGMTHDEWGDYYDDRETRIDDLH